MSLTLIFKVKLYNFTFYVSKTNCCFGHAKTHVHKKVIEFPPYRQYTWLIFKFKIEHFKRPVNKSKRMIYHLLWSIIYFSPKIVCMRRLNYRIQPNWPWYILQRSNFLQYDFAVISRLAWKNKNKYAYNKPFQRQSCTLIYDLCTIDFARTTFKIAEILKRCKFENGSP